MSGISEDYLAMYGIYSSQSRQWDGKQIGDNALITVEEMPEEAICEEHENYEWVFGKSPNFVRKFELENGVSLSLTVKHGVVVGVEGIDSSCTSLMLGSRYDHFIEMFI